jgi:hypothetical protein
VPRIANAAISVIVDAALTKLESEGRLSSNGLLTKLILKLAADTAFNLFTVDVNGEVADSIFEIIKEVAALNKETGSLVDSYVQSGYSDLVPIVNSIRLA